MGKSKEEDKIEKMIRGLLKLPENRRCINCNSLGPQYVCTNFWTFVCTSCSGIHREFTHRVKSISMAKFSMEEVTALQAGGNEKARQIYFKTLDPRRNSFPENSDIHRIRDFIKHVYVDRHYTGETRPALVPRLRNSETYEPYERRRGDISETSAFHQKSIDRSSRYSYDEVQSPQSSREISKHGKLRASSSCFDGTDSSYQMDDLREQFRYGGIRGNSLHYDGRAARVQVDDPRESSTYGGTRECASPFEGKDVRYQVDDTRIAGRAATQMFTTEDLKPRRRSPDRQQSSDMSRATVRHVKEILGENYLALRAANQPKFADRRCVRAITNPQEGKNHQESHRGGDGIAHCQKGHVQEIGNHSRTNHRRTVSAYAQNITESSRQLQFSNAELKPKSGSVGSLVAFEDLPSSSTSPDAVVQKVGPHPHVSLKPPVKGNTSSTRKNTLEFLLSELSTRAEMALGDRSGVPCLDNAPSSASSRNALAWHHEPAAPTSAQADECTLSAASVATTSTVLRGMPAGSTSASTHKVSTFQMMPDLLGDEVLPATEEGNEKKSPVSQHLDHSHAFVSESNSSSLRTSHLNKGSINQPTMLSPIPSATVAVDNSHAQPYQPALGPSRERKSDEEIQPSSVDEKASGRKELPADLFASPYQLSSTSSSVWQTGPNYGMGFHMQYYPPQQVPPIPYVAKSTNPFESSDNTAQPHVNMLASQGPLQGGLTNAFTPAGMSHTTSFGQYLPGFASSGSPCYPPGAYMRQPSFQNMSPTSIQGIGCLGGGVGSTVSLHSNQQMPYTYQASTDQSSFPKGGGNPFG